MAATVAAPSVTLDRDPGSPTYTDIVPVSADSDYQTGGYDIDALIKARIGAERTILSVTPLLPAFGSGGPWVSGYDRAAGKLMLFDWAGAEAALHTDCSTYALALHEVISY